MMAGEQRFLASHVASVTFLEESSVAPAHRGLRTDVFAAPVAPHPHHDCWFCHAAAVQAAAEAFNAAVRAAAPFLEVRARLGEQRVAGVVPQQAPFPGIELLEALPRGMT